MPINAWRKWFELRHDKLIPEVALGSTIPKTIIQTFAEPSKLPAQLVDNVNAMLALHPGWNYKLYSDDDVRLFIAREFPLLAPYYERIGDEYGAVKADFFRYLVIYKYGGIYLDIKVGVTRCLESCLDGSESFILSHWTEWNERNYADFNQWGQHPDLAQLEGGEYQQWHIMAVAGHPFLRRVIIEMLTNMATYVHARHGAGRMGVLRMTGPIMYTLAIEKIRHLHAHKVVRVREAFGLEYIFSDKFNHLVSFERPHYSDRISPIVRSTKVMQLVSFCYRICKKIVHFLFQRRYKMS